MIKFPTKTQVNRRIPKDIFYRQLTIPTNLKRKFIRDVESFTVLNSLTKDSLNLIKESDISEILVVQVDLKKKDYDTKILETISKQNKHKILYILRYKEDYKLALYYKKIYQNEWSNKDSISLTLRGFTIEEVWNSFLEQIIINKKNLSENHSLSLDEHIAQSDRIIKLEKEIHKLELKLSREKQFNKQIKISNEIKELKKELKELNE